MAEGSPTPDDHPSDRRGIVHRLVAAFVGLLGAVGLARAVLPESEPPADGVPAGPLPAEVHHPDGRIEHPSVRYERSDVSLGGVLIVVFAIACIASFHYWVLWWFFQRYNASESAIKRSPFPLAPEPSMKLPAEPRLEQLDRLAGVERPDVYLRLDTKERLLNGLGPTGDAGYVHIPIRRAMDLVVGHLPAGPPRPAGPQKDNGLLDSGEPNSGRLFRGERR